MNFPAMIENEKKRMREREGYKEYGIYFCKRNEYV